MINGRSGILLIWLRLCGGKNENMISVPPFPNHRPTSPHTTPHSGGYTNEEYSSDSDDAPLIDVGNSSPDDADEEDGLARYTEGERGEAIEE